MAKRQWIYRLRTFLSWVPLLFAFIWNHNETEAERLIWGCGGTIFLIGIGIRIWAQEHLHYRMGVHKQLTTTGPYRLVRNPLYIANILTYVGATICSELLWFVPVTLLWCIGLYSFVIRYEEAHLLDKYGDPYRRYLLEVPRWIPKKMDFRDLKLINGYLGRAILVESRGLLILLPFIIKEVLPNILSRP